MGGCKSKECTQIAKDIWLWAISRHLWLSVAHQPGQLNAIADLLSRHFEDGIEWDRWDRMYGFPEIDLFASRINHQTNTYVSWKQDPCATYVDAFTVNWSQFTNSYMFPPFCLISRCLQKIYLEQATVTIIVPLWTTQAWFTRLLSLLIHRPRMFLVTHGMQGIRQQFIECSISEDITNVLMSSWRPSTQKQYDVHIRRWGEFCLQRKVDSLRPNINDVLEFLHSLHIKELSYSTINTARSALSNYLMGFEFPGTHYTITDHPFVVRYLKGVFNFVKPTPRYQETWDVNPVLKYIELLSPLEKLSLKELTFKLVILRALTSGQRCQTLSFLDIDFCIVYC
ncbi:uncharacterized protein LOC116308111 [Actinia tenebrosa]|uniref:Uncharacterized protein LOC116308111 n=1 Tax=Actinia tenebrosa TaxID=6105 RepID=A0A6P8J404_ACTTE|nr:uncharacterized protein LOC116308111 [Actinia tenebrosa]